MSRGANGRFRIAKWSFDCPDLLSENPQGGYGTSGSDRRAMPFSPTPSNRLAIRQ